MRSLLPVLGTLLLVATSGCMGLAGHDDPFHEHRDPIRQVVQAEQVLVLEYTLDRIDEGPGNAEPGMHCGVATHKPTHFEVRRSAFERAQGNGSYLYVDPWLKGTWHSSGAEPMFFGLPASVDAGIADAPGAWTRIDVDAAGNVTVDGVAVEMPHHWAVTDDEGRWRIDARLTPGPRAIGVVDDQTCE